MLNQRGISQFDTGNYNYGESGVGSSLVQALSVILPCDRDMKEIGDGPGIPNTVIAEYILKAMKN
jgi:hypothetical protein